MVYQVEKGESGTTHLQGYLQFHNRKYFTTVRKLPFLEGAHFEVMRGTAAQARAYCMKEESRIEGPYESGTFSEGQGARNDLKKVAEAVASGTRVESIAHDSPATFVRYHHGLHALQYTLDSVKAESELRFVKVLALIGSPGSGKTRLPYDIFGGSLIYKLNCNTNQSLWFDGYRSHPVLLIDDFKGWIRFTEFLTILDIYPYRCQIKGGSVQANWKVILVTSNYPVAQWYEQEGVRLDALKRRITWTFEIPEDTDSAEIICTAIKSEL